RRGSPRPRPRSPRPPRSRTTPGSWCRTATRPARARTPHALSHPWGAILPERGELVQAHRAGSAAGGAMFHQPGHARGAVHRAVSPDQAEHPAAEFGFAVQPLVAEHEPVAVALVAGEGAPGGEAGEEFAHLAAHALAAPGGVALQRDPARAALDAGGQVLGEAARGQQPRLRSIAQLA